MKVKPNSAEIALSIFDSLPREPLTDVEAFGLATIAIEPDISKKAFDEIRKGDDGYGWIADALEKRAEAFLNVKIDFGVFFFLPIVGGTIGGSMLYLYYLQYWAKKHNVKEISVKTFSIEIFPTGFLSQKNLQLAWGNQKLGGDNLIDIAEACKSIML